MVPVAQQLDEARWDSDRSVDLIDDTVGGLLARRAAEHPDRMALIGTAHDGSDRRLTYDELLDKAGCVATAIRRIAEPGDMVALWAPNVIEWPVIEYGAAIAGVVLVAVNPAFQQPELEYVLAHSGSVALIHADSVRGHDITPIASRMRERFDGLRVISLADESDWCAAEPDQGILNGTPTDADSVVMMQYTSGTTGDPKGVLLRHRSLVNVARLTMMSTGVVDPVTALNPLPMFHTAACVIGTLGPLWVGGTVVLVKQFEPKAVLAAMRTERVRVLFFVPAVLSALVEAMNSADDRSVELDVMMGGAAMIAADLIEAAEVTFGGRVINLFGQTELAPVLSATRPDDSREDQLRTVGKPLPQVDCKVVDPQTGETMAAGQVGEICARGYQQFVAYHADGAATARTVDDEGFVHTGDLGSMDERGYLTVTGRLKELIIRGGENIAPAEIEPLLLQVDGISEAVVIGLPDERLGQSVAAVVRLRSGAGVDDLRGRSIDHLRERIASFKIPARWFVADELPLTPTGKVRRFAVVERVLYGELREL